MYCNRLTRGMSTWKCLAVFQNGWARWRHSCVPNLVVFSTPRICHMVSNLSLLGLTAANVGSNHQAMSESVSNEHQPWSPEHLKLVEGYVALNAEARWPPRLLECLSHSATR